LIHFRRNDRVRRRATWAAADVRFNLRKKPPPTILHKRCPEIPEHYKSHIKSLYAINTYNSYKNRSNHHTRLQSPTASLSAFS
jgi:hypothetical protein